MRIILALCLVLCACKAEKLLPEPKVSSVAVQLQPKQFDVLEKIDSSNVRLIYEKLHFDMHGVASKYDTSSSPIRALCVEAVDHLKGLRENDLFELRSQGALASRQASDSVTVSLYWRFVNVAGSEVCWNASNIKTGDPLVWFLIDARAMRKLRLVEMGK